MVKRWFVIIFIITLLTSGCILESIYTNNAFDFLENELKIVASSLEKDKENIDTEENIKLIEKLHEKWHDKLKVLRCVIWHSSNKDIENGISRAEQYIKENNYVEAVVEINALISYSHHYSEDFKISLENVF